MPDVAFSSLVPTEGSDIEPDSTFAFTVLNVAVLQVVVVAFQFSSNENPEVAYDGTNFLGRYAGLSSKTAVTGGTRYVFGRAGGWPPGSVTPKAWAVDVTGLVTTL